MADFTEITTISFYLSLEVIQEIVLAYSERRQCVGDSAIDPIEEGFILQDVTFWRGMQDWIETNCTKWVDDTNFSTSTVYATVNDTKYTLATFRTESGLNADGFKRATSWPGVFAYGKIVAGDIIGPWVVEELQAAFDAMRWTEKTNSSVSGQFDVQEKGIIAAVEDEETEWAAASWGAISTRFEDALYQEGFISYRTRFKRRFSNIPVHLPHSADMYTKPYATTGAVFNDCDGFTEDLFFFRLNYTTATTDKRETGYIEAESLPRPSTADDSVNYTFMLLDLLLIKWDFTNTLPDPA